MTSFLFPLLVSAALPVFYSRVSPSRTSPCSWSRSFLPAVTLLSRLPSHTSHSSIPLISSTVILPSTNPLLALVSLPRCFLSRRFCSCFLTALLLSFPSSNITSLPPPYHPYFLPSPDPFSCSHLFPISIISLISLFSFPQSTYTSPSAAAPSIQPSFPPSFRFLIPFPLSSLLPHVLSRSLCSYFLWALIPPLPLLLPSSNPPSLPSSFS